MTGAFCGAGQVWYSGATASLLAVFPGGTAGQASSGTHDVPADAAPVSLSPQLRDGALRRPIERLWTLFYLNYQMLHRSEYS